MKTGTRGLGGVYQPTYRDKDGVLRYSPIWWVRYRFRGKQYPENSHSTKKSDAVKLLRKRVAEMGRGNLIGPDAEKVTYKELAQMQEDDYVINSRKSLSTVKRSIKHLDHYFVNLRAVDITTDRISRYIRSRMEEGAKPATIRKELMALHRMFKLAIQAGRLATAPFVPSIEVRNTRTGFFERAEHEAICNQLPDYLKPVAEFGYLTGWRKGEVLGITKAQVDTVAGTIRLEPGTTKNNEARLLPFKTFPELAELIGKQIEKTEALQQSTNRIIPWLFHRNGERIKDFRGAWENACKRAGIPGRYFHDYRRTAVRNYERSGVSRSAAMKLVGQLTESIYRRYAIVCETDLAEGLAKRAKLEEKSESTSKVFQFKK